MTYTVLSARFANAEHSAAVMQTEEAGAVLVGEVDTPALWEDMLAQVEPAAFAPAVFVPQEVTKRQAEQALILAGLDEQLEALLAAMPGIDGKMARAEWRSSNTVRRDRPLLQTMAAALSLSEAQVDELFILAESLP